LTKSENTENRENRNKKNKRRERESARETERAHNAWIGVTGGRQEETEGLWIENKKHVVSLPEANPPTQHAFH